MFKKAISLLVTGVVLLCCVPVANAADVHTYTYTYDYWGEAVVSPDGYQVSGVINGSSLGVGSFSEPEDIFIDDNGVLYIVDSKNNRIVIADADGNLKKVHTSFSLNGEESPLNDPRGIFVNDKNEMLIADRGNRRVIRVDAGGKILNEYVQPSEDNESSIVFSGIDFLPMKVLEDINGYVYVLCYDVYQGALLYSSDGIFLGYYGANQTEATLEVIMNRFWRNFMTEEQRAKTGTYFPYQYNNFFIDDLGFIYTSTEMSDVKTNQIKRLNSKGVDILPIAVSISEQYREKFGDLKVRNANGKTQQTIMTDVTVDSDGFITAVDYNRGHIFQYSSECDLLMVFGGLGDQAGYFQMIASVENYGGKLYVLDKVKNDVTVFSLTPYGEKLHSAIVKYNNSEYTEAESEWREVISMNRNLQLAKAAIGKVYYEKEDYKTAMEYFKAGEDRDNYAKAYERYRNAMVGDYLIPAALGLILLGVLIGYIIKYFKWRKGRRL